MRNIAAGGETLADVAAVWTAGFVTVGLASTIQSSLTLWIDEGKLALILELEPNANLCELLKLLPLFK